MTAAHAEVRTADLVRQAIADGGFSGRIRSVSVIVTADRVRTTICPAMSAEPWSQVVVSVLVSIIGHLPGARISGFSADGQGITFHWQPRA